TSFLPFYISSVVTTTVLPFFLSEPSLAGVQSSSAVGSLYLSRGNLSSLAVGKSFGSGNSSLAVEELQSDLHQTKLTYGAAYTKLLLSVKKLEHKVKTSHHRRRERVVISDDGEDLEDHSKQRRKIAKNDENPSILFQILLP
nr:hypothetical protein [Tanacetum cinerariifolium]